jgi:hypothetical protein
MLKKIALGIVLAGVSGGLIYGAINRTTLRSETGTGLNVASGARGNQGQAAVDEVQTSGVQNGSGRNGGNGSGGQSRYNADDLNGYTAGTGLAQVDEVYQITGAVTFVDADQSIVVDETGSQTVIENRAWWYALEDGFTAEVGDQVHLTGFYDEGVFEAIQLENLTQSITVQIREESGRPLWAGGGRN